VSRYRRLAFRTACVVTGGAGGAEDAVQEAFLRAWRALPRFRDGAPFRPWMLGHRRQPSPQRSPVAGPAPLGLAYRLESALPRAAVLEIARSVR
jgi:hypothetical protein